MRQIMVTGGAGFIGCNFVRYVLEHSDTHVTVVDKLTYAGHPASLPLVEYQHRLELVQADIADRTAMEATFKRTRPDAIVNFAAESHVDRSIDDPGPFVHTNVVGTYVLLECARQAWSALSVEERDRRRFVHVSTDEVYGSLGETGLFTEETAYAPNSPYSATKAAADHLVRAYRETYGLASVITNCSNNYGPYQFPEKLVPLMVLNALEGRPLPIYGDGKNTRDWLYVTDHCEGIWRALTLGRPGGKYNIGGNNERTNVDVVDVICRVLAEIEPPSDNPALFGRGIKSYHDLKIFVTDRPGHDRRYAIDATRIRDELGWRPRHDFESGIAETMRWFINHREWCDTVQHDPQGRRRLGLGAETSGSC